MQTLIQSGDFIYSGGDDGKILRWKIDRNGTISISDLFLDTKKDIMDSQKL